MKNAILILFFFSGLTSIAQTSNYVPFVKENSQWSYKYVSEIGEEGAGPSFRIMEDTTINGVSYKKMWVGGQYDGAIRETNKTVYYFSKDSISESVLYDFNLQVGDTVHNPYGRAICAPFPIIVTSVDSMLLNDNHIKVYLFNSPFISWWEGVGNLHYLLDPFTYLCVSGNNSLECMNHDTGLFYGEPDAGCVVSVKETYAVSDWKMFPNPSESNFTIQVNANQVKHIRIYDITGVEVLFKQDFTENEVSVSIKNKGIYIVQITRVNGDALSLIHI